MAVAVAEVMLLRLSDQRTAVLCPDGTSIRVHLADGRDYSSRTRRVKFSCMFDTKLRRLTAIE